MTPEGSTGSVEQNTLGTQEEAIAAQEPARTFAELGLVPQLLSACTALDYTTPTPIQSKAIPFALAGRDIIALAATGSGKTAAFLLPLLNDLILTESPHPGFGCILAPTRELAVQIGEAVEGLGGAAGVRSAVLVGGVDMVAQSLALAKRPHIIIATPGRLVDHLENTKGFHLKRLRWLVLDEADRLLNMDFGPELDKIIANIPRDRHTLLFSATMTGKVAKLQRASLRDPVKVQVDEKYTTVAGLKQEYLFIPARFKEAHLVNLLTELSGLSAIVFVATCASAHRLAVILRNLGFPAIPLHGQMPQTKRLGALQRFKSGQRSLLVATDVAARGLDIPSVDLVVNYDVPPSSKDYIHRVGRTARAGRTGRAIAMLTQYDLEVYQKIESALNKKLSEWDGAAAAKEAVVLLAERVQEAGRIAAMQMREAERKTGRGKKHSREEHVADSRDKGDI